MLPPPPAALPAGSVQGVIPVPSPFPSRLDLDQDPAPPPTLARPAVAVMLPVLKTLAAPTTPPAPTPTFLLKYAVPGRQTGSIHFSCSFGVQARESSSPELHDNLSEPALGGRNGGAAASGRFL